MGSEPAAPKPNREPSPAGTPVSELPHMAALPREIMQSAARSLPAELAWFEGEELMLSPAAAAVCRRVAATDFSSAAWHLDEQRDADDIAIWLGLGGSLIADFSAAPQQTRIFAWLMSPDRTAAQHTLKNLKGRDGRWVPTSLLAKNETFLSWLDDSRESVNHEAVLATIDLGPVGFRFAIRSGALPSYFVLREADGASAQVVLPGNSPVWRHWLSRLQALTGHEFVGITSANFSDLGREVLCGGTHKDLAEVQADIGYLGVPILTCPIELDGAAVPTADRASGYKQLNAPYLNLPAADWESHRDLLPISLSLLSFTADSDRWELMRHGSLNADVLQQHLHQFGIAVDVKTNSRLEISNYVGDLVAMFPCFSALGPRCVAEISQLIDTRSFAAGEMIFQAGDPADRIYFVVSGTVAARLKTDVEIGPGQFFGEIAVVHEKRRTAAVCGTQPGTLLVLTTHILHRLMEDHPQLENSIRRCAEARESQMPSGST